MLDEPDWEAVLAQLDGVLLQMSALRRHVMRYAGMPSGEHEHVPVELDDGVYCSDPSCGEKLNGLGGVGVAG